jgi:hypothetical protein|nr:hypothetical protein [Candidatus Acidoferrales bacterium]
MYYDFDPLWKTVTRRILTGLAIILALSLFATFLAQDNIFQGGSRVATATQPVPLMNKGKTVFVSQSDKALNDRLTLVFFAIPSYVGLLLVIHFFVGVKVFDNLPTLAELLARRNSGI